MEKYRERNDLLGEASETSGVSVLQGGVDGRVDNGPPQVPTWIRARDLLKPANGQ